MADDDGGADSINAIEDAEGTSPTDAIEQGIAGIILVLLGGIAMVADSIFGSLARFREVIGAGWDFLVALITEPITILEMTSLATAQSIIAMDLGPLTFAMGVFSIVAAFLVYEVSGIGVPIVDEILPWR
ncbi:MAG: hypothetical protein ACOC8O_01260 [Natronomonas sp.]